MNDQQIRAYKTLAAYVLVSAISDLKSRHYYRSALRFLTHPDTASDRALWLSWLDMDDDGFQKLLRQPKFQNNLNKLLLSK